MPAPTDPVSNFLKKYHLWSLVLFFYLLGFRDTVSLAVWSWYRLLDEIEDASYTHKAHSAENKHRYDQLAGEKTPPDPHRAGD